MHHKCGSCWILSSQSISTTSSHLNLSLRKPSCSPILLLLSKQYHILCLANSTKLALPICEVGRLFLKVCHMIGKKYFCFCNVMFVMLCKSPLPYNELLWYFTCWILTCTCMPIHTFFTYLVSKYYTSLQRHTQAILVCSKCDVPPFLLSAMLPFGRVVRPKIIASHRRLGFIFLF